MSALPSKPDAEPVATREQVVAILELLETRMLWSTARPILSATGIHVSRGWRETLAHAREDSYSDAIWTSAFKALSTAARWHTYVGNKHVSFFDLREQNDDAKAQMRISRHRGHPFHGIADSVSRRGGHRFTLIADSVSA